MLSIIPATATTNYPLSQKYITFNNQKVSNPVGITHNHTTYMPLWYVMQLLQKIGISSSWDGKSWTLSTSYPLDKVPAQNAGQGSIKICLSQEQFPGANLMHRVNGLAAPDPYGGTMTTYIPIWYMMNVLSLIGIQSNWNGTIWTISDPNTTKWDVIWQFALGSRLNTVQQQVAGTAHTFDDVPVDNTVLDYFINQGIVKPDSATHFGMNDPLSLSQLDEMYWNFRGIAHNDYEPGKNPLTWGGYSGLNDGMSPSKYLTTSDKWQVYDNIEGLSQGFIADHSGVNRVLYPPEDEYNWTFNYPLAMPTDVQGAITTVYQTFNHTTYTTYSSPVRITIPTFRIASPWGICVSAYGLQYSLDNGETWLKNNDNIYDSTDSSHGGVKNAPAYVILKAPNKPDNNQVSIHFLGNTSRGYANIGVIRIPVYAQSHGNDEGVDRENLVTESWYVPNY